MGPAGSTTNPATTEDTMNRTEAIAAIESNYSNITNRTSFGDDLNFGVRDDGDTLICIEVIGHDDVRLNVVVWHRGYAKRLYRGRDMTTAFAAVEKFDWGRWNGMCDDRYPRLNTVQYKVDWLAA